VAVDPKIPLWLICPYDLRALDPSVIKEAHRSHPAVMDGDRYHGNSQYGGRAHVEAMFSSDLPELEGKPAEYSFTPESVDRVFNILTLEAYGAGLWSDKVTEVAATTRRLASCSLRRGAIEGTIRIWDAPHALICEVSDDTMIDDVLAGRDAALERARAGEGPTLIEAKTYRFFPHTSDDDDRTYRTPQEVEAWRKKDPLQRIKQYLIEQRLLPEDTEDRIVAEVKSEVEAAAADIGSDVSPRLGNPVRVRGCPATVTGERPPTARPRPPSRGREGREEASIREPGDSAPSWNPNHEFRSAPRTSASAP
jgi:hypothetical protein